MDEGHEQSQRVRILRQIDRLSGIHRGVGRWKSIAVVLKVDLVSTDEALTTGSEHNVNGYLASFH